MTSDIKAINYYGMDKVDATKLSATFKAASDNLSNMQVPADIAPVDFVKLVFDQDSVCEILIVLSRLPVFEKSFSNALSHDLELLALSKKLKFFTNLPIGQNLQLIQKMYQRFDITIEGYDAALTNVL